MTYKDKQAIGGGLKKSLKKNLAVRCKPSSDVCLRVEYKSKQEIKEEQRKIKEG